MPRETRTYHHRTAAGVPGWSGGAMGDAGAGVVVSYCNMSYSYWVIASPCGIISSQSHSLSFVWQDLLVC
jgi:hypothetical protein